MRCKNISSIFGCIQPGYLIDRFTIRNGSSLRSPPEVIMTYRQALSAEIILFGILTL